MKIERYWEDCVIYLVGFMVVDKRRSTNFEQITKTIHKTIVLDTNNGDEEEDEENVKAIIYERFSDVKKIDYVDVWSDTALRSK